jgi:hypothetical protein
MTLSFISGVSRRWGATKTRLPPRGQEPYAEKTSSRFTGAPHADDEEVPDAVAQLEYFVAVEREQLFGRAAAAFFVSGSALSESIRKLETELGVPLVRLGRAFQGLTPEVRRCSSGRAPVSLTTAR